MKKIKAKMHVADEEVVVEFEGIEEEKIEEGNIKGEVVEE